MYLEAFGLHSLWSNQTHLGLQPAWETHMSVPKSEGLWSSGHARFLLASYYGSVWPRTPIHRRQRKKRRAPLFLSCLSFLSSLCLVCKGACYPRSFCASNHVTGQWLYMKFSPFLFVAQALSLTVQIFEVYLCPPLSGRKKVPLVVFSCAFILQF